MEVDGDGGDGVAMAHPHLRAFVETFEDSRRGVDGLEVGASVLACSCLLNLTTTRVGDELCSIANAEDGKLSDKLTEVYLERLFVVDRVRASREDDANDAGVVLRKFVVREDFAEGVELTHTPSYELRGL